MLGPDLRRFVINIKIDPLTFCWEWQKSLKHGYGHFYIKPKQKLTHRLAYEHWNRPIPKLIVIDHLCKNKKCCNPTHLEAVSQKTNVLRDLQYYPGKDKNQCIHGHEFTPENIYNTKTGERQCKKCLKYAAKKHKGKRNR